MPPTTRTEPLEATPVVERYVEYGNRMTGAGISAGIDFGLRLAERLRGAGEAHPRLRE
jgi:cyclohexyl-isocyanide hydratase